MKKKIGIFLVCLMLVTSFIVVFSINSLASIYLLSLKINSQQVGVSDILLVFFALGMLSWNIFVLINH